MSAFGALLIVQRREMTTGDLDGLAALDTDDRTLIWNMDGPPNSN